MKVAIHDADGHNFPNLALMKLSAWHKSLGDSVDWFTALFSSTYDKIYSSKVFTFTPSDPYLPHDSRVVRSGTGYKSYASSLSDEVEHTIPDYGLYNAVAAYGFTTRGCPNRCPWCVVPKKEGNIRAHADIQEFWTGQRDLVLMDNNILAHEHGLQQLEQAARLNVRVDCNQGLDARLVDQSIAKILASVKWRKIRFACDHVSQMPDVERAIKLVRKAGGKKHLEIVFLFMYL